MLFCASEFPDACVWLVKTANCLFNQLLHIHQSLILICAIQTAVKECRGYGEYHFTVHVVLFHFIGGVAYSHWPVTFVTFQPG